MRSPSLGLPPPKHSRGRWLVRIVWAAAVAQILLIVPDRAGLHERFGAVLLPVSLISMLLLAAAAWRVTHRPQHAPAPAEGPRSDPVAVRIGAVALGGPCDGASWQLGSDELPAPRQVWLPSHGQNYSYRLVTHQIAGALTSSALLTYRHQITSTTDTHPG